MRPLLVQVGSLQIDTEPLPFQAPGMKLDFVKNISLTFIVSIFSILMGIIISFILSDLINPNAFGWEFPLLLFPEYWLQIVSLALLISLITSFLSVRFDFFKRNKGL